MYYFPQLAVNLYLTDNTRGGETKPLTSAFPVVFIYLKLPAKNAGSNQRSNVRNIQDSNVNVDKVVLKYKAVWRENVARDSKLKGKHDALIV